MLSRLNTLRLSLLSFSPISVTTVQNRGISTKDMTIEVATFANGCFWGTEHMFLKYYPPKENKGIVKTSVGYTGGREDANNPSYQDVCTGRTGHAEAVRIEFDPTIVKYEELVEFFYRSHDPTTKNRQGNDTGTQYRSAIFTHSDEQAATAHAVTAAVQEKYFNQIGSSIVTTIEPARTWFPAEAYHQEYLFKNPNGYQCPTHRLHW